MLPRIKVDQMREHGYGERYVHGENLRYERFLHDCKSIQPCSDCNSTEPTCPCRPNWPDVLPKHYFDNLHHSTKWSRTKDGAELTQSMTPFQSMCVYKAFCVRLCDVSVVILGQDPCPRAEVNVYLEGSTEVSENKQTNNGFAFCTCADWTEDCPPSVRNVIEEMYNCMAPPHCSIRSNKMIHQLWNRIDKQIPDAMLSDHGWFLARQGVLLLNCALTVGNKQPLSHVDAYRPLTRAVLSAVVQARQGKVVLITFGTTATKMVEGIAEGFLTHIKAGHPSTLNRQAFVEGAKGQFVGLDVFREANEALLWHGVATYSHEREST